MKTRLGFWSPFGILVAALAFAGLVAWLLTQGPTPFSPGALNAVASTQSLGGVRTHAELAGDCGACHPAPWAKEAMADRCLACHQNVGVEMRERSGLHGGMLDAGSTPSCRGCHLEHNGADASLTVSDLASFPHGEIGGYSLRAHDRPSRGTKTTCRDCHPRDLSRFDNATCADCHAKLDGAAMRQHTAAFGSQCVPCHDGVDRYGAGFDHDRTTFKLAGKHATLACGGCHVAATTLQALRQTAQDCHSCHAEDDEHRGGFGQECGRCHSPASWADAQFDHSKSKFPLKGAHGKVKCDQCHKNGVFTGTPTDCGGCHAEPEFHRAAFAAQSTRCADCHTADAFSPAQYTLPHDPFPTDHGAEGQTTGCRTCHPKSVSTYTCYGCHAHTESNIQGEHEGRPLAQLVDCIQCHRGGRGGD